MARILFIIVGLILALICLGMASMALSAGDTGGIWLFAAFAILFGAPAVAALTSLVRRRDTLRTSSAPVRFVPHWQLMAMIGIALLAILIVILMSIRC